MNLQLCSAHTPSDDSMDIRCHVFDKLIQFTPCSEASTVLSLPILKGKLPLADPDLVSPVRVNILLGAEDVTRAFSDEIQQMPDRQIQVSKTLFGWTITGGIQASAIVMTVTEKRNDLNYILENLWEREEPSKQRAVTLYQDTYHRLPDGQYSACHQYWIHLQNWENLVRLHSSVSLATNIHSKGKGNNKVLSEYEEINHSEKLVDTELTLPPTLHYYLPAHSVVKETSTTTKLCIVFDASDKTSSEYSLDTLLQMPSLCLLLTSILNCFRLHPVAISSDISKMFREVVLDPMEWNFHHFLHCSDKNGKVEDHWMKRLTFRISASPYLATQTLQQVDTDNQIEFPEAADTLKMYFYVDDCLTGTSIPSQAITLQHHPAKSRNDTPEMEE